MSTTRRDFIKTVGAAIATTQIAPSIADAKPPAEKRKVIYDQDNYGPFGTDILGTLMMLQADHIDLLGITMVTGDAWMKQEMAYTLRLLEMMGRPEIPVYPGAEFPMLNTKEEWQLRQQLYGGHRMDPWMGAFNRASGGPDEVTALPAPYGRFANVQPQQEHAARFIVKTVRGNPGAVTIYAGGPLTNIALAIALAPDIVPLVKEIVVMGAGFHEFTNSFNMFFDPESARKVLRAASSKCSLVSVDIAEEIHESDEFAPGRKMIEEIVARASSPVSDLFRIHALEPLRANPTKPLFRMADEMAAAQILDPSLFTKSEQMYVDICTTPGPRYGDAMFWPKNWQEVPEAGRNVSAADRRVFVDPSQFYLGPPPSAGVVNVLQEIDHDRFKKLFVELMIKPLRKS
ncbi:MAG TPA: nucleoside hydrolase [Candidatus Acidoferrales bacterium]|jgi:inosine-uridine nucleoside N-ribohydrolase|nr:nucleoside hydrolase [Candidatus Acidoferrales bacterium]